MPDFAKMRVAMVDTQIRPSDVTRYPVIAAMLEVPRELFVPANLREVAYIGENVALGEGRVVLEPRAMGKMLDALEVVAGTKVLTLGCGNGYSAALLARMGAEVVALEDGEARVAAAHAAMVEAGLGHVVPVSGPLVDGYPAGAPYDAILVDGGAVEQVPAAVTGQLAMGGRIVAIFAQGALGTVRIGLATPGGVDWTDLFHAAAPVLPGFARKPVFSL